MLGVGWTTIVSIRAFAFTAANWLRWTESTFLIITMQFTHVRFRSTGRQEDTKI
jgi:hypothetical protein